MKIKKGERHVLYTWRCLHCQNCLLDQQNETYYTKMAVLIATGKGRQIHFYFMGPCICPTICAGNQKESSYCPPEFTTDTYHINYNLHLFVSHIYTEHVTSLVMYTLCEPKSFHRCFQYLQISCDCFCLQPGNLLFITTVSTNLSE
jgi:hypothetical protein